MQLCLDKQILITKRPMPTYKLKAVQTLNRQTFDFIYESAGLITILNKLYIVIVSFIVKNNISKHNSQYNL